MLIRKACPNRSDGRGFGVMRLDDVGARAARAFAGRDFRSRVQTFGKSVHFMERLRQFRFGAFGAAVVAACESVGHDYFPRPIARAMARQLVRSRQSSSVSASETSVGLGLLICVCPHWQLWKERNYSIRSNVTDGRPDALFSASAMVNRMSSART